MNSKKLGAAILLILIIVVLLYFVVPSKPRYFYYGYNPSVKSHNYVIYGVEDGNELKRKDELMYIVLEHDSINVYSISDNVSKRVIPFGFVKLQSGETIVASDSFSENNIQLFEDTSINEFSAGIISFYIGEELDSLNASKHRSMRDSIFRTVFH